MHASTRPAEFPICCLLTLFSHSGSSACIIAVLHHTLSMEIEFSAIVDAAAAGRSDPSSNLPFPFNARPCRYQKAQHWMKMSRWRGGQFEVWQSEDIMDEAGQFSVFERVATAWRLRRKGNSFDPVTVDLRFWKSTTNYHANERRSKSSEC